jgi:hypothetical protein
MVRLCEDPSMTMTEDELRDRVKEGWGGGVEEPPPPPLPPHPEKVSKAKSKREQQMRMMFTPRLL